MESLLLNIDSSRTNEFTIAAEMLQKRCRNVAAMLLLPMAMSNIEATFLQPFQVPLTGHDQRLNTVFINIKVHLIMVSHKYLLIM